LETTGTTVQPGGFMSAAAGQMTLNVSQLNQIGGLLQEVNPDGSVNNAATQQLLAQVLQQLGGNFTQTAVSDDLHTHFVAAGGFGITQLAAMVAAIAASFLTAGGATMALGALANTLGGTMLVGMASGMAGTLASQIVSGNGLDFGAILKAGAISALTAGITNGITYNSTTGFGLNSFSQSVTALPPGTFTLGQLAGLSNISSALMPGATAASGTLPQMVLAMGAMATLDAGVQTAIGGGSFLDNLKNDAVADLAAAGAYAIGDEAKALTNGLGQVGGELAYTGLHAVLGCAASAAEGTGCAGGAVGGAAGALLNTTVDANGNIPAPLDVAMTTMVSGLVAGALGANAQGAATAAENETLNNWLNHVPPKPMSLSQADQYQQAVATGDLSTQDKLAALSAQNDQALAQACMGGTGSAGCQAQIQAAQAGGNQVYVKPLGGGLYFTYANPLSGASGPETFPFSYASGPQITALPDGPSLGAATLTTMQGSTLAGAFGGLVYLAGGSNANAYQAAQVGAATDGIMAGFAGFRMPEAPTLVGADNAAIQAQVLNNIATTQAGNASSQFGQLASWETAYNFYTQQGGFSADRTLGHLQGIDYTQPVTVTQVGPGTNYVQYVLNGNVGNYFAPIGTPAASLGINPANRIPGLFTPSGATSALQSTAASVTDTWTVPGEPFVAEGGGTQLFVPNKSTMTPVPGK
jgi:filamentous hemagglutinin